MKKLITLTLLCLSITLPSLANNPIDEPTESKTEGTVTYTYKLDSITLDDLKNHPEITGLLSRAERESISQRLTLDPTPTLWENLIPFGYGSFKQGDIFGGVSIAAMDSLSVLAIAGDLSVIGQPGAIPVGILFYVPLLIMARTTGVISPLLYAKGHNDAVHRLLSTPALSHNGTAVQNNLFSYSMGF